MAITGNIILSILLLVLVVLGGGALQVFLSLRKNKWFGLILPLLNVLFSVFIVLSLAAYEGNMPALIFSVLLIWNIPTAVNLVIYFACRSWVKRKNNQELERMSIQDL